MGASLTAEALQTPPCPFLPAEPSRLRNVCIKQKFFPLCCPICTVKKILAMEMNVNLPFCSCTLLSRWADTSVSYFWLAENLIFLRHPQEEEITFFCFCHVTALFTLFSIQPHGYLVLGSFSIPLFYFITFKIEFKLTCEADYFLGNLN